MRLHDIEIADAEIHAFCSRHRIREMRFFGSILTRDFGPDSDIDVIVEFEAGATPDLFDFAGMQLELSGVVRRQTHLNTPDMVHPDVLRARATRTKVAYAA